MPYSSTVCRRITSSSAATTPAPPFSRLYSNSTAPLILRGRRTWSPLHAPSLQYPTSLRIHYLHHGRLMSAIKPNTSTSFRSKGHQGYKYETSNLTPIERLSSSMQQPQNWIQSPSASNISAPPLQQKDDAPSSDNTNSLKSYITVGRLDLALTVLLDSGSATKGIMSYPSKDRRLLFARLSDLTPPELTTLLKPWIQRQRQQQQDDQTYSYNKYLGQFLKSLGSTLPMNLVTHLLDEFPLDTSVQTAMFSRFVKNYMANESNDIAQLDTLLNPLSTDNRAMNIKVRLYNMALNGSLKKGNGDHVDKILVHMDSTGCLLDAASYNMLIRSRLDKGDVEAATALYGQMSTETSSSAPTTATYNTFIKYACQHQLWNDMTLWLDRLLLKQNQPNPVTLRILMAALTDHVDQPMLVEAFQRVANMVPVKSIELEMTINVSIVHLLRHKHTDQALDILYMLFDRSLSSSTEKYDLSVYSYNLLIHALAQKRDMEAAERVLASMRDQQQLRHDGDDSTMAIPSPDTVSYTTLIHGYIRSADDQGIDVSRILELYNELMDRGLETNAVLQAVILYGMVKSGFQDIKKCTSLFESMVSDNDNDRDTDTLNITDMVNHGQSYEPQWHLNDDICGNISSNLSTTQRKKDPKISRMTMYNMMMDGYFLYEKQSRRSSQNTSAADGATKRNRHIPPEPLALLNRAIEKKLPLTTATLNIWVRGLALFNHDLVAAESMVHWMTMAHGVELNERTIYYLVQSSIAQDRRDKARKWIKRYEDSGRTIEGTGLQYLKDILIKS